MERVLGKVKWFSPERGYGFVTVDGNDTIEYFIHFTSIKMEGYKTLKADQKVSFVLVEKEKGIQATDVELA
jgi:CspA family cold shock protein